MIEFMKVVNQVVADWWLLIAFFTAGGIWWQLKAWFNRVNSTLDKNTKQHDQQCELLDSLHTKVDAIESRQLKIEEQVDRIHEEVHTQEIKLAVLESGGSRRPRKKQNAY